MAQFKIIGKVFSSTYSGFVIGTVIITNTAVFCRYVLQTPMSWGEEIVMFTFVWLIFIGAALAYREDGLIDISMLTDLTKGKTAKFFDVLRRLLSLLFIVVVAYQSINIMLTQFRTGQTSPAMEFPLWLVTGGLVFGSVLWLFFGVAKLFSALTKKNGEERIP